jgi:BREX system ATP-binding protein BrxC/D
MGILAKETAQSISKALRSGTVPDSGLEHYAVGLEPQMKELTNGMDYAANGNSDIKFIRGHYGSGKTFLCSLAAAEAMDRGFVVSKVVISTADTPLYKLEEVYKKICSGLTIPGRTGCFSAILDQWLYKLEEQVIEVDGLEEDAPEFREVMDRKVDQFLQSVSEKAGRFSSCLKTYHKLQMDQEYQLAQGILDWLAGDSHVSADVKRMAHVKGDIKRNDVFAFFGALLEVTKQAGYKGIFLVLDEVETILRQPREKKKGLEVLRQFVDAAHKNEFPGLYLMVTGTPDFFESPQGVPALPPLKERINVNFEEGKPDNLRQPQIRLPEFDQDRLVLVAKKVREIFPADHPERVKERVHDAFVVKLVDDFTNAFGGKVSVTPRLFLRKLIDEMDRVDQYEDYDPNEGYEFKTDSLDDIELTPQEQECLGKEVFF